MTSLNVWIPWNPRDALLRCYMDKVKKKYGQFQIAHKIFFPYHPPWSCSFFYCQHIQVTLILSRVATPAR